MPPAAVVAGTSPAPAVPVPWPLRLDAAAAPGGTTTAAITVPPGSGTWSWRVDGLAAWVEAPDAMGPAPGTIELTLDAATFGPGEQRDTLLVTLQQDDFEVSYPIEVVLTVDPALPITLTGLDTRVDGDAVWITWETASETNNAGFEVEERLNGGPWRVLGFVAGAGTTSAPRRNAYHAADLDPGVHYFRLRQVDHDGTFAYSPEVEVTVGMTERFVLEPAYPNPFNPQTTLRFGVQRPQWIRIDLHDAMGRQIRTLYQGTPPTGRLHEVHVDGGDLASSVYLVRLSGDHIQETRQILLVK